MPRVYRAAEHRAMFDYLLRTDRIDECMEQSVWVDYSKEKNVNRSPASLWHHFTEKLSDCIEDYVDDPSTVGRFRVAVTQFFMRSRRHITTRRLLSNLKAADASRAVVEHPLEQSFTVAAHAERSVESTIVAAMSVDLSTAMEAMATVRSMINSPVGPPHIDANRLVGAVTMQLQILGAYPKVHGESQVSAVLNTALLLLRDFYSAEVFGRGVSLVQLTELLQTLLDYIAMDVLYFDDLYHNRDSIQNLVNTILYCSDHTQVLLVLIQLLRSYSEVGAAYYEEMITSKLEKIAEELQLWDFNYDRILLEVHQYVQHCPSRWYEANPSRPITVMKLIVNKMVEIKGAAIFNHLGMISNPETSKLQTYLHYLINFSEVLPRQAVVSDCYEELKNIFNKIASKCLRSQGIAELYQFESQYPDVNVEDFILE